MGRRKHPHRRLPPRRIAGTTTAFSLTATTRCPAQDQLVHQLLPRRGVKARIRLRRPQLAPPITRRTKVSGPVEPKRCRSQRPRELMVRRRPLLYRPGALARRSEAELPRRTRSPPLANSISRTPVAMAPRTSATHRAAILDARRPTKTGKATISRGAFRPADFSCAFGSVFGLFVSLNR